MNKRKGFLEELKNNNTQKTKLKFYIQILQFYFAIYDLDNGTNHLKIIGLLYTVSTNFTYEKIAKHIGISDATLARYVRKYNDIVFALENMIGETNYTNTSIAHILNLSNLDGFIFEKI